MSRYLILAAILLFAGLFITLHPKTPSPSQLQPNGRNQSIRSATESAAQSSDLDEPSRTKSKNRIQHPKPTIEETTELLKNTIIPRVDIQDQSLLEVAAAITSFIQEAGIPPHKLRVIVDKSASLAGWRIKEVRVREVPIAVLLKFVCDSTKLRCRIEPGIIRFCFHTDYPSPKIPETEESDSPIELPSAPDDPFGGSPTQGANPFAEPEIPTSP